MFFYNLSNYLVFIMEHVEVFAERKGLSVEEVIKRVKEGFYSGTLKDGTWYIKSENDTSTNTLGGSSNDRPAIVNILFLLAGLSAFGGIIFGAQLMEGVSLLSYQIGTAAYIPAITAFTMGIVQSVLFVSMGYVLIYLSEIASNTKK